MKKILIWGMGKCYPDVLEAINKGKAEIIGVVDSNIENQKSKVYLPAQIENLEFDYIVISVKMDNTILKGCVSLGIDSRKVIRFWKDDLDNYDFFDQKVCRIKKLEKELIVCKHRLFNLPYELGVREIPIIKSSLDLLRLIMEKHGSLCRFGDGEFDIMRGTASGWFQTDNVVLRHRLIEVLNNERENVFVAIADNFGNLDKYTEDAADSIRGYMTEETRQDIMKLIIPGKIYWNAYVSRPYLIYKNKNHAKQIFKEWKRLWKNKNVLIVEGEYGRTGIGNDLFSECKSIKRIVCPHRNAFDKYDMIFGKILDCASRDDLILITLGQTATVLAYDLAKDGYQAIDIGQLDNEYDWFMMGSEIRTEIKNKAVAELNWCHTPDIEYNAIYERQIVSKIL